MCVCEGLCVKGKKTIVGKIDGTSNRMKGGFKDVSEKGRREKVNVIVLSTWNSVCPPCGCVALVYRVKRILSGQNMDRKP